VWRLLQAAGVAIRRPKQCGPVTTESRPGDEVALPLLVRQFAVIYPAHVWADDLSKGWPSHCI
jgi:hypothetical protein